MRYRIKLVLDTGHPPEEGVDPVFGIHEFNTHAEANAFCEGIHAGNEATCGWTDGFVSSYPCDEDGEEYPDSQFPSSSERLDKQPCPGR